MGISVSVRSTFHPDAHIRELARAREIATRAAAESAREEIIRRTLSAQPASENGGTGAIDTGRLIRSWRVVNTLLGCAVTNDTPYAEAVDQGRSAGRAPPSQALEGWVERQMGLEGSAARGMAFIIARKIGERGLKPRFIVHGNEAIFAEIGRKAMKDALTNAALRISADAVSRVAAGFEVGGL